MIVKLVTFADTFTSATAPDVQVVGDSFLKPAPTILNGVVTWGDVDGYELLSPPVTIDSSGNMFLDGYLQPAVAGSLTEAVSSILTITGADTLLGNTTIEIAQASSGQAGYLAAADFQTFDEKMSNPLTTTGDMIYSSSGTTAGRLAIGASGYVLQSNGSAPTWVASSTVGFQNPMTTASDMITATTGGAPVRLAPGNLGDVLTQGLTAPAWIDSSLVGFQDPMTTTGDIIYRGGGGTTRLAIGSSTQVLTVSGGIPAWAAASPLTTNGDLYYQAGGVNARLPIGTANQVLTVSGGLPVWSSLAGSGDVTAASNFGTDNRLIRSDGTTKGVQASAITVDDSGNLSGAGSISGASVTTTGAGNFQDVKINGGAFDGIDLGDQDFATSGYARIVGLNTELQFRVSPGASQNPATILSLDGTGSGGATLQAGFPLKLAGATSGTLTIQQPATITSHTLNLPSAQGASNTFLKNDGSGNLSWATSGTGDVLGPASSTDNALVRFDSTTGKLLQNSGVTLSDTDQMAIPAGSAAAPSYSFSGDPNTGIYAPAADQVGISTLGTLRLSVTNGYISSTIPFEGDPGSASAPTYSFTGFSTKGMYHTNLPGQLMVGPAISSGSTANLVADGSGTVLIKDTLSSFNATGTNVAASDLVIQGGGGTGNATPAPIVFKTTQVNGSGSSLQTTYNTKLTISSTELTATVPISTSDATDSTSTTTGAVKVSGGVGIVKALSIGSHLSIFSGASASELRLYEPSGSGTNYTAFKAQAQAGNVTYTLPAADGSSGQVLSTNGTGTLSWATAAGSGDVTAASNFGTDNRLIRSDGTTKGVQASDWTLTDTTGQMQGPAGTAAAPSYSFSSDTDTGIYSIGADHLGVSTGGALTVDFGTSSGLNTWSGRFAPNETAGRTWLNTQRWGVLTALDADSSSSTIGGGFLTQTAAASPVNAKSTGGLFAVYDNSLRTNAASELMGLKGEAYQESTAAITTLRGFQFIVQNNNTGTVTNQDTLYVENRVRGTTINNSITNLSLLRGKLDSAGSGTKSITNMYGLHLEENLATALTITNKYGVYENLTNASNYWASPHRSAAGSASTPSYSFSSDTNTGIYSAGADSLSISTNSTERLNINSTGQVKVTGQIYSPEYDDGNSGTADTIDWNNGNNHKSTLTGNVTYTFSNPVAGSWYTLKIVQGASAYTVTWPAAVKWSGGTAPTITTTNAKIDIVSLYYDGTSYYGSIVQNF